MVNLKMPGRFVFHCSAMGMTYAIETSTLLLSMADISQNKRRTQPRPRLTKCDIVLDMLGLLEWIGIVPRCILDLIPININVIVARVTFPRAVRVGFGVGEVGFLD